MVRKKHEEAERQNVQDIAVLSDPPMSEGEKNAILASQATVEPSANVQPAHENAVPETNGNAKRTVDRSNPPEYMVIGESLIDGRTHVIWRFPTIGQLRKGLSNVMQIAGVAFKNVLPAKIKYLTPDDLEKEEAE